MNKLTLILFTCLIFVYINESESITLLCIRYSDEDVIKLRRLGCAVKLRGQTGCYSPAFCPNRCTGFQGEIHEVGTSWGNPACHCKKGEEGPEVDCDGK